MFWQKRLDDFIVRMGGHDLPLRLRLWNGREAVLGPSPIVTFEIKSISALRRLLRPSLASLGQAYVDGLIDIEGALDDVIAVAARLSARAGRR
ncbi:MAG: SAM-dependent methyltransferase, partial [Candidatus Desulfobacillus denitrificans]